MMHITSGLKQPKPIVWGLFLIVLLAAPSFFVSRVWAQSTTYCPGSPWNCDDLSTCEDIWWCQDDPDNCGWWPYYNFGYRKYRIVKQCEKEGEPAIVYCTSCGEPQQADCCTWVTSEPACPPGANCD